MRVSLMSDQEIRNLFAKWRSWLENELLGQMQNLIIDRRIFLAFRRSVVPFVGREGAEIAEWIARNYVANVCTTIRRLGDRHDITISLRKLLEGLHKHADLLTAENFEKYTGIERDLGIASGEIPGVIGKDLEAIDRCSSVIKAFVDITIAHTDKKHNNITLATFGDAELAFERFHFIYRRYAWWLIGTAWQPDDPNPDDLSPPDDENYETLFSRMWQGPADVD